MPSHDIRPGAPAAVALMDYVLCGLPKLFRAVHDFSAARDPLTRLDVNSERHTDATKMPEVAAEIRRKALAVFVGGTILSEETCPVEAATFPLRAVVGGAILLEETCAVEAATFPHRLLHDAFPALHEDGGQPK